MGRARDVKQLRDRTPGVAGADQRAGIDIPPRQHSVERRVHVLEPLQLFQSPYIRIGSGQVALACSYRCSGWSPLAGDRVGLAQRHIAIGADLGQVHRGHNLLPRCRACINS